MLFPGFHDDDAVHHGTLEELTRDATGRRGQAADRSGAQERPHRRSPTNPPGRTPPIIRHFCQALPEVRDLLRTDIEAAFEGDPAALDSEEIILSYPFIEAIAIQRLAHRLVS